MKLFQFILDNGKWWIQLGVAFCVGAMAMYIYIFSPQGFQVRIQSLEQNQQAIIAQINANTNDLTSIKAFIQKAVDEANAEANKANKK